MLIDLAALAEISKQVDAPVKSLLDEVYRLAGHEFNVGSPAQLAQVLYEELKLPVLKKDKTGPSTDHEVLEKLAEQHPLPRAIIEYRNVAKLKSTYLDTLPALVGRRRAYSHHAAPGAGGHRAAVVLRPEPAEHSHAHRAGQADSAGPSWPSRAGCWCRPTTARSSCGFWRTSRGDEGLIAAFAEAADVHARTAAEVFGVAGGQVTAEQRRVAKMVNYGIAYGLSAHGLSTRLNHSRGRGEVHHRPLLRSASPASRATSTRRWSRPGERGFVETPLRPAPVHARSRLAATAACRWPPSGRRSTCPSRARPPTW